MSWSSKMQTCISRDAMGAEYVAFSMASTKVVCIKYIAVNVGIGMPKGLVVVLCHSKVMIS